MGRDSLFSLFPTDAAFHSVKMVENGPPGGEKKKKRPEIECKFIAIGYLSVYVVRGNAVRL